MPRTIPIEFRAGRARALTERSILVGRHVWLLLLSGAVEPVLFLFVFGYGFENLIDVTNGPHQQPVRYITFVAPALLAVTAMNGALHDATFNVFAKLRSGFYETVLSTPLGILDIVIGETSWAIIRGGLYSAGFVAVMLALRLVTLGSALCCLAVALLVSAAFSTIGMWATTFLRNWQDYSIVTTAATVQFLFSTTFYPLSYYPVVLQWVVRALPLYQAIDLLRAIVDNHFDVQAAIAVGYLLALTGASFTWSTRRLARRLVS